jgi:Cellulase (glycosyl hydrolase family 5)/RTX calcium-binding nonapeptide repeat (4 copies)
MSQIRLRRLGLAVAVAATFAWAAPTAMAAQPGVISDLNWGLTSTQQQTEVAKLSELGVRWIRLNLEWRAMEPQRGSYSAAELANIDRSVDLARSTGANVLVVVFNAPAWASGSSSKTTPSDPADFGRFMSFVAARYAGRVAAYEIWNEEDLSRFWTGGANPSAYTALLKAAYPAVKAAAPGARVVFGGLDYTWYGIDFLGQAYDAGAKGYFDAMGVHGYTLCGTRDPLETKVYGDGRVMEGSFARYRNLRATMLAHGDDKPVWITEFGWNTSSAACNPGGGVYYGGVSEATQADFLTKAFELLEQDPYVEVALWYMSRNYASDADAPNSRYGLMTNAFVPKPAFSAFRAYAEPDAPAAPGGTVSVSGSQLVYRAAAGAVNAVTISLTSGSYTVKDTTAGIVAGSGCAVVSPGIATCSAIGVSSISADGGDGNDRLTVTAAAPATLLGGPGNDLLEGGPKADVLQGGKGADALAGFGGSDTATYASRTTPVTVSLDGVANDGGVEDLAGAVRDDVRSDVENLTGGSGADTLTGNGAANKLVGGGGIDTLLGMDGADVLKSVGDALADVAICGPGADVLKPDLVLDQFPTSGVDACETLA